MKVFQGLYNYRELLKTSIKKEIRSKYKNSFLGVLWSFLNPLLQIMVYAVIFSLILKNKQEHYAIFLCCGIVPWTFFSTSINKATFTLIENGNIIYSIFSNIGYFLYCFECVCVFTRFATFYRNCFTTTILCISNCIFTRQHTNRISMDFKI